MSYAHGYFPYDPPELKSMKAPPVQTKRRIHNIGGKQSLRSYLPPSVANDRPRRGRAVGTRAFFMF